MTARTHWFLDKDALETLGIRRSSKYLPGGFLLIALALFSSGCERERAPTPAEMLVGKWNITANDVNGKMIPDDGSYLEFDACSDDTCTGTDHLALDATTGSITYDLAADGRTITITDTSNAGGMFRGTWTILKLDEKELWIGIRAGNLGAMGIELEKVQ